MRVGRNNPSSTADGGGWLCDAHHGPIGVQSYELVELMTEREFHDAIREAEQRGLFDLPGLVEYRFCAESKESGKTDIRRSGRMKAGNCCRISGIPVTTQFRKRTTRTSVTTGVLSR